jgi:transposase
MPYVKRGNKNDAADAAAICEAVTRPHMRSVLAKTAEQQSVLMLHRAQISMVRQRTMLICALRGHLAEFGIIAGQGKGNFAKLVACLGTAESEPLRAPALAALRLMADG